MHVRTIASILPAIVTQDIHSANSQRNTTRNSKLTGAQYYQELIQSQSVNRFR